MGRTHTNTLGCRATSLSVSFIDDETVEGQIKGTDADNDLAVVAVKLSDIKDETKSQIKIAVMGNSDDLEVGDQVVAIGNAQFVEFR